MKRMLEAKEVVKAFYERYSRYVDGVLRFIFALSMYLTIMYHIGYNIRITYPAVAVVLALISAVLPVSAIPIFTGVLMVLEFASVSPELAAVTVIMLMVMMLTYFVFKAGDSWLMSFSLLMMLWGVSPMILPLGLLIEPIQIIVVVFAAILYALIIVVKKDASVLSSASGTLTLGGRINLLLNDLVTNQKFLVILVMLSVSLLVITLIRRSRINYAPQIASIVGGVIYLIGVLLGDYFTSAGLSVVRILVGTVLGGLLAFIIITFVISVDYKRIEQVQFEDDEYYYYVKAVPKISVGAASKQVESITGVNAAAEEKGGAG